MALELDADITERYGRDGEISWDEKKAIHASTVTTSMQDLFMWQKKAAEEIVKKNVSKNPELIEKNKHRLPQGIQEYLRDPGQLSDATKHVLTHIVSELKRYHIEENDPVLGEDIKAIHHILAAATPPTGKLSP